MTSRPYGRTAGLLCAFLVLACTLVISAPVFAATATTNFTVSATVVASCSVTATNLGFGTYTPSTASPNTANSTVKVTCTTGTPYTISLDGGTVSGSVTGRNMSDGASHLLSYALYTTSSYGTIWGDGSGSTGTVGATGNGSAQTQTVYGSIPAGQFVTPASYSDQVGVTVTY